MRAIIALISDKTPLGDTTTIAMLLRRTELEEESVDVYAVLRGAEADGSTEAGAVPVTWGVERRREAPSSPAGHEHSAPAVFGSPLEMSAARPEVPTLRERCLAIGGVATRFRTRRCGIHDIHSTWRDPLTASDGARLVGEHRPTREPPVATEPRSTQPTERSPICSGKATTRRCSRHRRTQCWPQPRTDR